MLRWLLPWLSLRLLRLLRLRLRVFAVVSLLALLPRPALLRRCPPWLQTCAEDSRKSIRSVVVGVVVLEEATDVSDMWRRW